MDKRKMERLLKKERYSHCQYCGKRFRIGPNPDQKYCRASCYKADRRRKSSGEAT